MNESELAQWLNDEYNKQWDIYAKKNIRQSDEEKAEGAWLLTARQLSKRFVLFHPQPEVEVKKKLESKELLEELSALEHDQWVEWRKNVNLDDNGCLIPSPWVFVTYDKLPWQVQEEDKVYARRVIRLLKSHFCGDDIRQHCQAMDGSLDKEASVATEDESSSKVIGVSESASVHSSHVDATRKSGGESDDTGSVTSSVPPKGVLDEIDRVFSWADCQENLSRKDLLDQLYHDVLDILIKNKSAPMTIPMIDDCGVCGHNAEEHLSGRCEYMKCKCTKNTTLRSV